MHSPVFLARHKRLKSLNKPKYIVKETLYFFFRSSQPLWVNMECKFCKKISFIWDEILSKIEIKVLYDRYNTESHLGITSSNLTSWMPNCSNMNNPLIIRQSHHPLLFSLCSKQANSLSDLTISRRLYMAKMCYPLDSVG